MNVATIYVLDKDEALDFYVNKLGLEKGNDVRQGDYRWLTVRVPGERGTEISLEQPGAPLHDDATAAQIRELITKGAMTGLVFNTDDARGLYETLKSRGVTDFTQEPTDHFYGTDMGLRDPFGNAIRILQQGKVAAGSDRVTNLARRTNRKEPSMACHEDDHEAIEHERKVRQRLDGRREGRDAGERPRAKVVRQADPRGRARRGRGRGSREDRRHAGSGSRHGGAHPRARDGTAPDLVPRTYYGMPAYAKDGKVICFFKAASKFKVRYATFEFQPDARLDDGDMWPVSFAVTKLTPDVESRIAAFVRKGSS